MRQLAARLLPLVDGEQLAAQRWFAAKGRAVAGVSMDDALELPVAAQQPTAARPAAAALAIATIRYVDGGADRYLLPLVAEPAGAPRAPLDSGGLAIADPGGGWVLREPSQGEGVWTSVVDLARQGGDLRALRGSFRFRPTPAFRDAPGAGKARLASGSERHLRGEQSNSAVVLEERIFLKCYRRLDPGLNPEVEILEFLSRHSFDWTPALLASVVYAPDRGEPAGVAIVQELVPDARDAWGFALGLARGHVTAGDPDEALAAVAATSRAADAIGALTARLHAALASAPGDPGFPVRPATPEERREWLASAERQFEAAVAAVPGEVGRELRELEPAVRAALQPLGEADTRVVIRIHGDYHLGQLLQRDDAFFVIDFEGEPARPLAERRRPHSPLKDLAGMLRSLEYAAGAVGREAERAARPDAVAAAGAWLARARQRFLAGYRATITGSNLEPHLDERLLRAFEVEKACYEIRYEARNRPEWLWLPLSGLRALVRG